MGIFVIIAAKISKSFQIIIHHRSNFNSIYLLFVCLSVTLSIFLCVYILLFFLHFLDFFLGANKFSLNSTGYIGWVFW
jgi:hypothetical protein